MPSLLEQTRQNVLAALFTRVNKYADHGGWTLRALAAHVGASQAEVAQVLVQLAGLKLAERFHIDGMGAASDFAWRWYPTKRALQYYQSPIVQNRRDPPESA